MITYLQRLLFAFCLLFLPLLAHAAEKPLPFQPGEKLTYDLWWSFIPVGETVLEVKPHTTLNGETVWHFYMESKSNAFLDMLFKVRDYISSYVDEDLTHALKYDQDQQEGKFRRDILVDFDWKKNQAVWSNFGKKDPPLDVMEGSFDPLSIIYKFRTFDLAMGKDEVAPVSDGKKSILGTAKIVKRETLKIGKKKYDVFLVEPEMKHIGGIFKKERKAKIKVWFTTDQHHYPVRVESKVSIGSFWGEIKSIQNGGARPLPDKKKQ